MGSDHRHLSPRILVLFFVSPAVSHLLSDYQDNLLVLSFCKERDQTLIIARMRAVMIVDRLSPPHKLRNSNACCDVSCTWSCGFVSSRRLSHQNESRGRF